MTAEEFAAMERRARMFEAANEKMLADNKRLREENARLREVIERVLVGGNHVALLIGADHPPDTATHDTAIKHYGSRHYEYEAWCCWKAIRAAAAAIREGGKYEN